MNGDIQPTNKLDDDNIHANQSSTTLIEAHYKKYEVSTPSRSRNQVNQADDAANTLNTPPPPVRNIVINEVVSPQMVQRPKITTEMEERFDLGYDSDEQVGPFFDAILEEGDQLVDEKGVPDEEVVNESLADEEQSSSICTSIDIFIPIEDGLLDKMKVAELRDELSVRQLSTRGKKQELRERLKKALIDKVHVRTTKSKINDKKKSEVGIDFAETARWELLQADVEEVNEPTNPTFHQARAPTVAVEDAGRLPPKFNFSKYNFDIPEFTGFRKERKKLRGGRVSKVFINTPISKGFMKPEILKKFKLSPKSLPHEWVNVFILAGYERLYLLL